MIQYSRNELYNFQSEIVLEKYDDYYGTNSYIDEVDIPSKPIQEKKKSNENLDQTCTTVGPINQHENDKLRTHTLDIEQRTENQNSHAEVNSMIIIS